jgi:hypothetical protein
MTLNNLARGLCQPSIDDKDGEALIVIRSMIIVILARREGECE